MGSCFSVAVWATDDVAVNNGKNTLRRSTRRAETLNRPVESGVRKQMQRKNNDRSDESWSPNSDAYQDLQEHCKGSFQQRSKSCIATEESGEEWPSARQSQLSGTTQSQPSSSASSTYALSRCPSTSAFVQVGRAQELYSLGDKLGAGRFGTVVACMRRQDNRPFACKIISSALGFTDAAMEVEVLQRLRGSPYVVQLEAVFLHRSPPTSRRAMGRVSSFSPRGAAPPPLEAMCLCGGQGQQCTGDGVLCMVASPSEGVNLEAVEIVMERCYGGTLADKLKDQGMFSEKDALKIIHSVVQTLQLLHQHGFICRDIKDTNFLFRTKDADSPVVAIDFGLATKYKQGESLAYVAGSPLYIAPEVVCRAYGPQCDVWSAGVLFYQLLCGRHPFQRESLTAILKAVTGDAQLELESAPWPSVSVPTKDLLRQMLTRDPATRPTPANILSLLSHLQGDPRGNCGPKLLPQHAPLEQVSLA